MIIKRWLISFSITLGLLAQMIIVSNPAQADSATLGLSSSNYTYTKNGGWVDAMKFYLTSGAGTLTKLELLIDDPTPSGKVKLGVYSNINGLPGNLLLDAGEIPVSDGWAGTSGLSLPVANNTYYWLVFSLNEANGVRGQTGGPAYSHYFAMQPYGSFPQPFPATATSENTNTDQYTIRATINTGNTIVPPTVSSDAVTNITSNSAFFYGTLSSLGSAGSVSVSFEFGSTTGYGGTTESKTISTPGAFSFNTYSTPLAPNTTYHYRARAVGDTIAYGQDMTFTTLSNSSSVIRVSNEPVSNITANTADVSAYLSGLGTDSSVQVSFEYGLTTAYGSIKAAQSMTSNGIIKDTLSGLSPTTLYHYRVKATGATITYGDDATFRTYPAVAQAPSITTREPSSIRPQSVYLHGTLTATGSSQLVYISFQWGTVSHSYTDETSPVSYGAANPVPQNFNTFLDGLIPGTTYYYRAKVIGDGISYGSEMVFATPAYVDYPAAYPVTNLTSNSAILNGSVYLFSSTSVNVSFQLGTGAGNYTYETSPQTVNQSRTTFTASVTGLLPNTTYYFRVKSLGLATAYSEERTFSTTVSGLSGKIALVNEGNILISTVNGDNRLQLTNTGETADPAISPNGTRIAFTSTRDGNKEIYTMNIDGTNQIRLTNDASDDQQPDWSPDGTKLVFSSARSGTFQIWVMDSDGSNLSRLTNSLSQDTYPSWSPNNSKIVFCRSGQWRPDLYTMNIDGSHQSMILPGGPALGSQHPVWSPDGTKIALVKQGDQNYISVVNADGTNGNSIYSQSHGIEGISWSPDGTRIAFSKWDSDSFQYLIFAINVDGNNPVKITSFPGDSSPFWR